MTAGVIDQFTVGPALNYILQMKPDREQLRKGDREKERSARKGEEREVEKRRDREEKEGEEREERESGFAMKRVISKVSKVKKSKVK